MAKPTGRTWTGHRLYGEEEMARLMFVKRAKRLGLTLEEVRELVSLAADRKDGEIVPSLEDVLEVQLEKTESGTKGLATFRESSSTTTGGGSSRPIRDGQGRDELLRVPL